MTSLALDFPGNHLSLDQCDEFAFRCVRPDWLIVEAELMFSKWFDYRFMHPAHATLLYAHLYKTAWRAACRTNFDRKQADHAKILKHDNIFMCEPRIISALWRGRMVADSLGMPYDVYLASAFTETLRFWRRRHMPQPQNLYSADVIVRVGERWKELQAGRLFYSTLEPYKVANSAGDWCQAAHVDWLLKQAAQRGPTSGLIERFKAEGFIARDFLQAA